MQQEFFELDEDEFVELLDSYEAQFGKSARRYAERTAEDWRSERVQMSGQTAQRLLDLLPPLLSAERRFELIQILRRHCMRRVTETIRCTTADWEQPVRSAVERLVDKSRSVGFPPAVLESAKWLTGADAVAAQSLMAKAEIAEAAVRTAYLRQELERMRVTVNALEQSGNARSSHRITLPQGDILIEFERQNLISLLWGDKKNGKAMSTSNDTNGFNKASGGLVPSGGQVPNVLDFALEGLSESEVAALRGKAIEGRLQLDLQRKEAAERLVNSTKDMAQTIQMVRALDESGQADYSVNSVFESASGKTTVQVNRQTNRSIVVIAIVIGVVLILALMGDK